MRSPYAIVSPSSWIGPARSVRTRRAVRLPGEESVGRVEARRPLGGGMELGADSAQRPVRLRREQQHDHRDAEVHRAGGQPEADADGDQRDRQGRDQLQHNRRREAQTQRLDGGPAVAVGHRADRGRLRVRSAVGDQGREPPDDVEEVPGECGQLPPLAGGPVARADTPMRAANTGISGNVQSTISPLIQSNQKIAATVATGSTQARTSEGT